LDKRMNVQKIKNHHALLSMLKLFMDYNLIILEKIVSSLAFYNYVCWVNLLII
jgi:hypothetical protein